MNNFLNNKTLQLSLFIGVIFLQSCIEENAIPRFELLNSVEAGVDFINEINESDSVNMLEFTNIYNGAGVGIGDFNNDGKPDLYFCGNIVSGRLYINHSSKNRIAFKDVTAISKVGTSRWATGVSVVDINADGLLDIYISVSGSKNSALRKNYLFVHQGLNEQGIPVFDELAEEYGIADESYSSQAAFFDYDLDGDLDLFIAVNYPENVYGSSMNTLSPVTKKVNEKTDRLYKNTGLNKLGHMLFQDVSAEAGILYKGYSLGISVMDINEDGWADIYLSNDFLSNDIIYINNQNGSFTNKIGEYFKHTTFAGMGCDIADINNDGLLDIGVLDMIPSDNMRLKSMLKSTSYDIFKIREKLGYFPQFNRNTLQLNNGLKPDGNLSFSEIARYANIHFTDWSWSILFADLNNNGWKDAFISNGYRRDMQNQDVMKNMFDDFSLTDRNALKTLEDKINAAPEVYVPNRFFVNQQDLTFEDVSKKWGINMPSFSSGTGIVDLDNDGDLELIISNLNESPHIYKNNTIQEGLKNSDKNYIKISFKQIAQEKQVYGTKVRLRHGENDQYIQYYPVHGYLSSMDMPLHFGLGEDTLATLRVMFPDSTCLEMSNLAANQLIEITNGQSVVCDSAKKVDQTTGIYFEDISQNIDPIFEHSELAFNDFEIQPLIIKKYSQMGPGIACADIDRDGLDDFFIGGGLQQPGKIYRQTIQGKFQWHADLPTENFEDQGAVFFDADNDGDKDLYIVSGGVEYNLFGNRYADHLFLNDGEGNFVVDSMALSGINTSGFCVSSADFDQDGDLDLFIGGKIDLKNYPDPPRSYLLLNESDETGVTFTDVTAEYAPELLKIGMVSSGLWTDVNNDGLQDLIIVGEWMPITVFLQKANGFVNSTNDFFEFPQYGLWNSINGGDFDKDGDTDYICGNLGLNTTLRASRDKPLLLFSKDFDNNGNTDPLLFQFSGDIQVPVHPRDVLIKQMPSWETVFPSFSSYSDATLEDFLRDDSMGTKIEVTVMQSIYLENQGEAGFKMHNLPKFAQLSSIKDINTFDINGDGNLDIVFGGNSFDMDYTSGPIDASIGYCMLGDGHGRFDVLDGIETGLLLDEDVQGSGFILGDDNLFFISGVNNSDVKIFRFKNEIQNVFRIHDKESHALIYYKDGRVEKREFYFGKGYLSSSSRILTVSMSIAKIEIYNFINELCRTFDYRKARG